MTYFSGQAEPKTYPNSFSLQLERCFPWEQEVKEHQATLANAYVDMFYLEKMTPWSIQVNEEQCRKGSTSEENRQTLAAENLPGIFREHKATGSMYSHVPAET